MPGLFQARTARHMAAAAGSTMTRSSSTSTSNYRRWQNN